MMTEEEIYLEAVKKKRVFELGYCWRCAERPASNHDLGLCHRCRQKLSLPARPLVA